MKSQQSNDAEDSLNEVNAQRSYFSKAQIYKLRGVGLALCSCFYHDVSSQNLRMSCGNDEDYPGDLPLQPLTFYPIMQLSGKV